MNRITVSLLVMAGALASAVVDAASVDDLMEADREFDRMAQEQGVRQAFLAFVGEDPAMLADGLPPITGDAPVHELLSRWPDGMSLTWEPRGGRIAASGDLGYTWGLFVSRGRDAGGAEVVRHGKYVTVWSLEADGSWKWVVDIGNHNPPPNP